MPVTSRFNRNSSARDVVAGMDLTGRTAIVTGGASGIGVETARALAEAGADVIIAARNAELANKAVAEVEETAPGKATWDMLDLSSLRSVRAFAERWASRPLDMLINNAGVMACPLDYTEDGLEMQIGTNHFGHFLLGGLLAPALAAGAQRTGSESRLISLSSNGHKFSGVDFDDLHFHKRPYDRWKSYGQSKTANVLFARAYDEKYRQDGIRAFSLMPGVIFTPLMRHISTEDKIAFGLLSKDGSPGRVPVKTPEQGAATSVWAATGSDLQGQGGIYLEDCQVAPVVSDASLPGVMDYALNADDAQRLWDVSRNVTGF